VGEGTEGRSYEDLRPGPGGAVSGLYPGRPAPTPGTGCRLSGDGSLARLPEIKAASARAPGRRGAAEWRWDGGSLALSPAAPAGNAGEGRRTAEATATGCRSLCARAAGGIAGTPADHLWRASL